MNIIVAALICWLALARKHIILYVAIAVLSNHIYLIITIIIIIIIIITIIVMIMRIMMMMMMMMIVMWMLINT